MKSTTKHSHPGKKRYVHAARKGRVAGGSCRVITSGEFLHDPKRAVAWAAKGTQVCIKGGTTQIIIGLKHVKARAAQHKGRGLLSGKIVVAASKRNEPLDVSWIE